MKILLFLLTLLAPALTSAQNAVGVVSSTTAFPGQVSIQISVSESTGSVLLGTSFTINFTSSTNQMNADIKQRIRDILIGYGVTVPVNNIILFGGAQ